MSEYGKFYTSFRDEAADVNTRLGNLQEAENNYYITAKYVLSITNRAFGWFVSSEVDERRQIIKLILSNLRIEGENVLGDVQNPFDLIINYSDRDFYNSFKKGGLPSVACRV